MNSSTLFLDESHVHISNWPPPAKTKASPGRVHIGFFAPKRSDLSATNLDFDALALEIEGDTVNQEDLAVAGSWVADQFYPGENATVRTARLRKGFSQKQLAALIGTSQPHVANIEKGDAGVMFQTVEKLCAALDITPNDFQAMVKKQKTINAQKEAK